MAQFQKGHPGGPGRPKKADKFAGQIAAAEQQIADRLAAIIDAQFDLALGITVREVDEDTGGVTIYTRPPDVKAGQYLIDRILGKPTQRTEVDADPDGSLEVTADAMQQATRELESWRKQMTEQLSTLSNSPNVPPMPPMPVTPMD